MSGNRQVTEWFRKDIFKYVINRICLQANTLFWISVSETNGSQITLAKI